MNQIVEFFSKLLDTSDFPARWHCGEWSDFHGWLYIIANLLIWSAYFMIPLFIIKYVFKQKEKARFNKIYILFASFIVACGSAHFIDAYIFWVPVYRLNALLLLVTGIISWITVFQIIKILPQVFSLKSPEALEKEITLRKEKEVELLNEIKEKQKREHELEESNKLITEQNSRLLNFAYIVSHNLRSHSSNLTSMVNLWDISDQEERNTLVANVKTISNGLNQTIDYLSEVVSINARTNAIIKKVKISDHLKHVLETLSTNIKESKAEIIINITDCDEIEYVSAYLESLLLNFISNAIKYRHPNRNPVVEINTAYKNDKPVITIKDNGLGIDLEKHGDKLFGMYKTFHDNANAKGIGLFMTKNQIESLGGTIDTESEINVGTTFTIYL